MPDPAVAEGGGHTGPRGRKVRKWVIDGIDGITFPDPFHAYDHLRFQQGAQPGDHWSNSYEADEDGWYVHSHLGHDGTRWTVRSLPETERTLP